MQTKVPDALQGEKVDAILCVAGGWGGGNAASPGESLTNNTTSTRPQTIWLLIQSFASKAVNIVRVCTRMCYAFQQCVIFVFRFGEDC